MVAAQDILFGRYGDKTPPQVIFKVIVGVNEIFKVFINVINYH